MGKEKSATFIELKKKLPHGYSTTIVERLEKKGIKVTARNVQYVANGQISNADIEAEILGFLDELIETQFEAEVKKRLEKLK